MTDTAELERRLSEATGESRELDARIAAIDGLHFCWCGGDNGGSHCDDPTCKGCGKPVGLADERHSYPMRWQDDDRLPRYTDSIDSALALVERKLPGWRAELVQSSDGTWWDCYLGPINTVPVEENSTDRGMPSPALAVLLALIRALATNPQEPT